MQREQRPLSDLARVMQPAPQTLINVRVSSKPDLTTLKDVNAAIEEANEALAGKGRVLVRYSGTEKKCRVMVEGADPRDVERYARRIADAVEASIGA